MSFGFSIGDCLAVIQLANKVRKDFTDAPKQFEHISTEVRSLSIVLLDVDIFLSGDNISDNQKYELGTIIDGCREVLKDTESTLEKYRDLENKCKSIRNAAKRAWKRLTFEPEDVRQLRSRITSNITLLNSFIGGVTRDNVAKVVKRQDQQEHQEILNWLTPIDYAAQQSDFISRRQAGTGQWLLDSTEYQHWIATAKESLFCPGIPGAGKTILASIVVNDLLERFPTDGSTAICYIYCNFRRTEEQKLDDLLGSLLRQLAQGQAPFPRSIMDLYERHKDLRTRPSIEEICTALHSVTASYSRVFVVVDALDECDVSNGCRPRFVSELLRLRAQLGANLLATSRFIPDITERFSHSANKEIRATVGDIGRYLEGCMIRLPRFVSTNIDLQETIKEKIINAADGMFLLAKLHLDSLKGKRSPTAVRTALERFATGSDAYDVAYTDAMNRISSQLPDQKQLAFQTLSWIACARRPLKTVELQHALGTEPDESAFDEENVPDIQDVVSNCCGLVTVDEQTQIVRLVHYTTQEYFERTQNHWFPDGEADITKVCISYLSFDAFKAGRCESDQDFEHRLLTYPLYDYASHYWGSHARSITRYPWNDTFLGRQSQVDAAGQGLLARKSRAGSSNYSMRIPMEMTGLHLVAYTGLEKAAEVLFRVYDHNGKDSYGRTSLSYAAMRGHEAVVRLLLDSKAEVDSKDQYGLTPLSLAARNGHKTVVQMLLHSKADIELKATEKFNPGRTPLFFSAMGGHDDVVWLLLREKAKVDSKEQHGRTPLSIAAWNGHEAAVRLLLEEKAEVDSKPTKNFNAGRTPLLFAAMRGHDAVVRLLLDSKANLDSKDQYGRTPLSYAAENGQKAVAQLLLDWKAEVDSKATGEYNAGQTPLSYASRNGHEAVVRLLLDKKAEVDAKHQYGQTPLSFAAENGHEAIVRLLLEQKAEVDSRATGEYIAGQTPLSLAASNGHEAVVRLLLEQKAEVDAKDKDGWTPLLFAAKNGYEAVVRLLLEQKAEVDAKDPDGQTPLSFAAGNGHEAVVRLLLDKKAEVDAKDQNGWTPLSFAAWNGHEAIVRLLLKQKPKADLKDQDGRTPLLFAAEKGQEVVVRLLLEQKAEADSRTQRGRTPLSYAAAGGHEVMVRLLLEQKAEADSKDQDGSTPLSFAAENGHDVLVRLLLESKAEADSRTQRGRTPLSYAAAGGHETTIQLLLWRKASVNSKDRSGRTPLSYAAAGGHEAAVRLLLENKAEADSESQRGRTPLSYAAAGGHEVTVRLLLESKAEANSKDQTGKTPLAWAASNGCTGAVNLLLREPMISLDSKDHCGRSPLHWALWNGHKDVAAKFLSKGASEPVDLYGIWTMFSGLEGGMDST